MNDNANATHEVVELVAAVLELPPGRLAADASMETVPEWDSLAQLNVCMRFQERFGVEMDMETIADATSVPKLTALLAR